MSRLWKFLRWVYAALVLFLAWLAPLAALAQAPAEGETSGGKSYVLGYALTTLCIGLGIFAVVKPGKRKAPKIKRRDEEEEEKKPVH